MTPVRVVDKRTRKRFAFSSTHAVPEVMWRPGQEAERGAPSPYAIKPRAGTATLHGFKKHLKALRAQVAADRAAGFISIVGADLNVGYEYERKARWTGFQTRTIDYVYAFHAPALRWLSHATFDSLSDHHVVTVRFGVRKR